MRLICNICEEFAGNFSNGKNAKKLVSRDEHYTNRQTDCDLCSDCRIEIYKQTPKRIPELHRNNESCYVCKNIIEQNNKFYSIKNRRIPMCTDCIKKVCCVMLC